MSARRITAAEVRDGDTLCLTHSQEVVIERITEARCDGAIGLHGADATFSSWYRPTDRVLVRAERFKPQRGNATTTTTERAT